VGETRARMPGHRHPASQRSCCVEVLSARGSHTHTYDAHTLHPNTSNHLWQLDTLHSEVALGNASTNLVHMLGSMRKGLSQTLETVLSQAMARDVMHGDYLPRNSPCLVTQVTLPPRRRGGPGLARPSATLTPSPNRAPPLVEWGAWGPHLPELATPPLRCTSTPSAPATTASSLLSKPSGAPTLRP